MALTKATLVDLNANELILDLDADTSITADTDDTIHFRIGGSDEITITGTALSPASADGNALGTAALEWSDLFLADSSTIQFGADQDTILTHTDGTGLTLNSTNKLCFNDASQFIQGASATVLDIAATDEIELTATLIDVVGNFTNSGTIVSAGIITAPSLVLGSTAVTTTPAELNLIDGDTSRGTTAVASGDGLLVNDGGQMRMTNVDTVSTYFASHTVGGGNIVTTGALASGSIAAGFGAIDNGTSGIRSDTITAETAFVPDASGGADLGTTALEFNNAYFNDSSVINFGDDQDTTLTHTDGTGLTLNSTNKLCFNDASQFVQGSSATVLSIGATDEIDLTATAIDINGTCDVSGAFTAGSTIVATGVVTAAGFTVGSAVINEAELETIDGITAGTVIASKAIITDSNIDITGGRNITITGVMTGATLEATGDTAAGDNAAIGYTSAEGLILTGQGSSYDVTIKNDADAIVCYVPTGQDDLTFPDNARILVGTSADLQISHDGSHSFISEQGTGSLKILGSAVAINNAANNESMAVFTQDGSVDLYYNDSKKFETTSAGATVTGTLTATLQANAIDSDHYVDGSIDLVHMSANSVDSDQYVDGSIDTAHIANDQITAALMADNSIDSDMYVDGSIDTAHIANDQITAALMADNSIDSDMYVDGSIDLAHLGALGDLSSKAITHVGLDSGDYIYWANNSNTDFYLNGNLEFRMEADGDFHADGDVIAYSTTVSDATLKYNINPIEFALDKVNQLKGVTFNYFKDDKESAGLLAQDVEKVMPSAVSEKKLPLHTNDDKKYKTLHYDSIHALLIESIKELTTKLEESTKRIETLENR